MIERSRGIWTPSRENTFDRADRRYVVRGDQRCNAFADLQQSLGRTSAAINRVVPEQKRCQVYLYLSLVLIMSSEPNGIAIRRCPRLDQIFCADITDLPIADGNIGYPRSFDL